MRASVFSRRHIIMICFIILFLSITAWPPSAIAIPSGTQIPVVINIHKDAGISEDDAKKAVEEASKMLKQAGIKLTVVKVNPNASDGDTGNDGVIDFGTKEWEKMIKAGKDEIEKTPNKKGIKISFVKTPKKDSTTPGWAVHREPVAVVKNRGDANLTGQTIAHEIGHILTLGAGHKIDDSPTTANDGGHAPDKDGNSGKGNLMAPSNYRIGTNLTKDQIDEIKTQTDPFSSSSLKGKCSAQFEAAYPAEKVKHQHGAKTDALNDNTGGAAYTDLFSISLGSSFDSNIIHGELSLGDLFSGDVNAFYSLAFDSDNDPLAGYGYNGFTGMEYALEMNVNGTAGNYSATGLVRNLEDNTTLALPEFPLIETGNIFYDLDQDATLGLSQLLFDLEKSYVGLDTTSATEVNVGILAQENSTIYDTDSLLFDLDKWLDDPTLQTFGNGVPTPGELYDFAISGLLPDSDFNLFLDEDLVFSGTLDSTGSYTGGFDFPDTFPNDTFHFLTAQDSTGEFAYSITCPTPEPSTCLLFLFGILGMVGIKKKFN